MCCTQVYFLLVFYQCFTSVSPVLHQNFTCVLRVFHQWFASVLPVFHQCCTNVSLVFHLFLTSVSPVFQQCFIREISPRAKCRIRTSEPSHYNSSSLFVGGKEATRKQGTSTNVRSLLFHGHEENEQFQYPDLKKKTLSICSVKRDNFLSNHELIKPCGTRSLLLN